MASYSSPTVTQVSGWCGLSRDVLGLSSSDYTTLLTEQLAYAEARVALTVGSGTFTSASLTSYQVSALQMAAACLCGALFLRAPASQDATGTEQPTLMDADQINAEIDRLNGEAAEWLALVANAGTPSENRAETSFSDTTEEERIFSRGMTW